MKRKVIFLALLYFPGTVLHELSHFFAAKLLGVPTGNISLTPKFKENSIELGHVEIAQTDFIRRFIVGVAPLIVGVSVLSTIFYLICVNTYGWWVYILFTYIFLTVANTMNLSRSDLLGSWKILALLGLAIAFLIALH